MILVDTSVWIDFFSAKPKRQSKLIADFVEDKRVVTCKPIVAEILSGQMSPSIRRTAIDSFQAMSHIDLDWNAQSVWNEISEIALTTRKKKFPMIGIVDRIILLAAKRNAAKLWTYDKKLEQVSNHFDVGLRFVDH